MGLSLCMIVRDEAATLPTCLASVRDLVDEQVIVDTGSRDRTVEIAKDFGAQVYDFAWCDDFAAARNAALTHVQADWILVLDADEVLLPEVIPAIKQVIQAEEDWLVVNLVRQELGAKQVPYSLVSRLFRNHPAIQFSRPYHESIDASVIAIQQREPHWKVLELAQVAMRHSGYAPEAIAPRQKVDRARRILETYLANHPEDAYTCSKLGALYIDCGETDQGLQLLQRGLQVETLEPAVRYELHYNLGCTYSRLQNYHQAETHFQSAIEQRITPYLKLGTYNNWGNMRMEQNNPVAAQVLFQKTVEIDPNFALGFFNLGTTLKTIGHLEAAISAYQQAISLAPDYAEAHQGLGVALIKGGRVLESVEQLQRAIALYEQQGSPEAARLQQVLREMKLL